MFFPKKPSPSEYAVLVWFVCSVFIILGIVALVIGFRVRADKHDLAALLQFRGAWSVGIGIAVGAGYWLYRRLVDY